MDVGRRIAAVVGLAIVVAVLTACTSGDLTGQPSPAGYDPTQAPLSPSLHPPATGAPSAGPGVGWSAEIAELSGYAQSDFERAVFADGEITREEYDQAHELWLSCVEKYTGTEGPVFVELGRDSRGFYTLSVVGLTTMEGDPILDEVMRECEEGTTLLIAGLFNDMSVNPDNRDFVLLIVECLVREGVVEPPYELEDYYNDVGRVGAPAGGFQNCEEDPLLLFRDP